jgi:hypothetical protein
VALGLEFKITAASLLTSELQSLVSDPRGLAKRIDSFQNNCGWLKMMPKFRVVEYGSRCALCHLLAVVCLRFLGARCGRVKLRLLHRRHGALFTLPSIRQTTTARKNLSECLTIFFGPHDRCDFTQERLGLPVRLHVLIDLTTFTSLLLLSSTAVDVPHKHEFVINMDIF